MPETKTPNLWTQPKGKMRVNSSTPTPDERKDAALTQEVAELAEIITGEPTPFPAPPTPESSRPFSAPPGDIPPSSGGALIRPISPGHARGVAIRSLDDLLRLADTIHKSGLAPRSCSPPAIAILIQFGLEVGLGPMQALQMLYVLQGKIAWYGKSMLALCQAHPQYGGITESWDGETASCSLVRNGKSVPKSFSLAEAKTAGIYGGNWLKYPCDMAMAKARKRACDAQFSDVLLGLPDDSDNFSNP